MIIRAFLALVPLLLIGVASEFFWRAGVLKGEGGRKFIHILSGIWISLWPLFLSMKAIAFLGAFLVLGLIVSRALHIFHAVYGVKRKTLGEYFYPLAILLCAVFADAGWQFSVAILLLGVADGFAAIVGTRYKKIARPYNVFGATKSVLGTATYFVCAILIFVLVGVIYAESLSFATIVLLSLSAAFLENVLPYGSDNVVIPLAVVLLLPQLT